MAVNTNSLRVSEARKRLSALIERVARGGAPIGIGRYGRDRAVLVSAEEYARLKASVGKQKRQPTLEGTLTLTCSPQELISESQRLGEAWLAALEARPRVARSRRRAGAK